MLALDATLIALISHITRNYAVKLIGLLNFFKFFQLIELLNRNLVKTSAERKHNIKKTQSEQAANILQKLQIKKL